MKRSVEEPSEEDNDTTFLLPILGSYKLKECMCTNYKSAYTLCTLYIFVYTGESCVLTKRRKELVQQQCNSLKLWRYNAI